MKVIFNTRGQRRFEYAAFEQNSNIFILPIRWNAVNIGRMTARCTGTLKSRCWRQRHWLNTQSVHLPWRGWVDLTFTLLHLFSYPVLHLLIHVVIFLISLLCQGRKLICVWFFFCYLFMNIICLCFPGYLVKSEFKLELIEQIRYLTGLSADRHEVHTSTFRGINISSYLNAPAIFPTLLLHCCAPGDLHPVNLPGISLWKG